MKTPEDNSDVTTDKASDDRVSRSKYDVLIRLGRKRIAMVGLGIVVLMMLAAIFAPWVAPNDPLDQQLQLARQAPSRVFPLGTDNLGRCVLSRLIFGTRVSLSVGFMVVTLRGLIGIPAGLAAGFYGGKVDSIIMRVTDVFIAFPGILLAIAVMAVWGPGIFNVMLALAIVGWPQFARLVRGEVLGLKEQEFVEAGRAMGLTDSHLIFKYLLPNILGVVVVYGTLGLAAPIVSEAALSFLGLGTMPPTISWGRMLAEGRRYMRHLPWLATYPGVAITITVLGFNLFGDGLRDVLDPRQRD